MRWFGQVQSRRFDSILTALWNRISVLSYNRLGAVLAFIMEVLQGNWQRLRSIKNMNKVVRTQKRHVRGCTLTVNNALIWDEWKGRTCKVGLDKWDKFLNNDDDSGKGSHVIRV